MSIFSIIIPVYNAEKTIERTLASFISNKDFIKQIIIVNDACTDNTMDIVQSYEDLLPIQIITNVKSLGPGPARKLGIEQAQGQWLTFVDADDCLTASSLYYVYNELIQYENIVLLHTKTIYYESGCFNAEDIAYSDYSCGGNFYKTAYLKTNNLFPHDTLRMAEDEYFNHKIKIFIRYYDQEQVGIEYFDYPVYQVHHDIAETMSFAHSNWVDYIIKYHLLAQKYLTEYFKKNPKMFFELSEDYMKAFIFSFFALQSMITDNEMKINIEEQKQHFKEALKYFTKTFFFQPEYLINFYNENQQIVDALREGVEMSVGMEISKDQPFKEFVDSL